MPLYGLSSDIHDAKNNWKIYLEEIENRGIDHHFFGGDLATIKDAGIVSDNIDIAKKKIGPERCVSGNHDRAVVDRSYRKKNFCGKADEMRRRNDIERATIYQKDCDIAKYLWQFLADRDKDFLERLKKVIYFDSNGSNFALVHDIYAIQEDIIASTGSSSFSTRIIDSERAAINFKYMENMDIHALFVGHTHMPAVAKLKGDTLTFEKVFEPMKIKIEDGSRYIINVGSLSELRDYESINRRWHMLFCGGEDISFGALDTDEMEFEFIFKKVI